MLLMSKNTKTSNISNLFSTYSKTKNAKVLEKAVKLVVEICSSPLYTGKEKLHALTELTKHKEEESIENLCSDIISRWRDSLLFLKKTDLEDVISLLIEVIKIPELSAHEKIYTAVHFYNSFNLHVCYQCFRYLCSDTTLKIEYRIESVLFLFASGEDEEKSICLKTLLEIIKNHDYTSEIRYKAISSFISKTGIKTFFNSSKLKIPYEEGFCCALQTTFFDDIENDVRYRILSGQHLLQMECVLFERKREIVSTLFSIADSKVFEENIRADALDVILRLGDVDEKTKSRKYLGELGVVADGSLRKIIKPKIIYDDSQNIHNENISDHVQKYLEKIVHESSKYPTKKFDNVKEEISTCLRKIMPMVLKNDNLSQRHAVYQSLARIAIDTATFTQNHVTVAEIICHIWSKIHYSDYDMAMVECLEQRMIDELIDMEGTCSSGHACRFVNVLSIVEETLKISWDTQLKANVSGRMGARIRDCQDDNLRSSIALGMLEDADEEDREIYLKFIETNMIEIEEELYKEFVSEGYIKEQEFYGFMKVIKSEWLCVA